MALGVLLATASGTCFAMTGIELVSRERATQLGIKVRSAGAGSYPIRVVV